MTFLSSAAVAVMILTGTPERDSLPSAFALVVGSRNGGPGQNPLHYAGTDAARFSDLLIELGRYAKNHVRVLQDPSREQLLNEVSKTGSAAP